MHSKLALPGINLHVIDTWLNEDDVSISDVGDVLPYIFCITSADLELEYLNSSAFEWLCIPPDRWEEAKLFSKGFYRHRDALTLKIFLDNVGLQIDGMRSSDVLHDLQRMWFPESKELKLCMVSAKWSRTVHKYLILAQPLSEVHFLKQKISRLADEEVFYRNNYEKYRQLTEREKEVMSLLTKGYNNPEISKELAISRNTVEQHRKNINRKLATHSLVDLIKFAQAFDLQQR